MDVELKNSIGGLLSNNIVILYMPHGEMTNFYTHKV
jgi:hypothetical protein